MKTPETIIIIIPINLNDGFSKLKRKANNKTNTGVLLLIIAIYWILSLYKLYFYFSIYFLSYYFLTISIKLTIEC